MHGTDREKLSPAESSFQGDACEVRPGVDLANVCASMRTSSWIRITHVTCIEWIERSIRVEPRRMTSSLNVN